MFEASDFIEVYMATPLDICELCDPKGLYRKARPRIKATKHH